jgi:hypothetical protein
MISFEVFEETGPAVNGRGTVTPITNVNWKRIEDVTQTYFFNPLRRPDVAHDQTLSYKKYIFFKISGDYTYLKNIKIQLTNLDKATATATQVLADAKTALGVAQAAFDPTKPDTVAAVDAANANVQAKQAILDAVPLDGKADADKTQLFYKFTNTYTEPDANYGGQMMFADGDSITWFPTLSSTDPLSANSRAACYNNQTIYTGYLVTQLRVNQADYKDVGNSAAFQIQLSLNEFE